MKATKAEQKLAVDAAQAVIKIVEGHRGVVLAEAMAILVAYHIAQLRGQGVPNPTDTLGSHVIDIGTRGIQYEAEGLFVRAH